MLNKYGRPTRNFLVAILFLFYFDFPCFGAIFNKNSKTVIPLKLFRYEIISYLARVTDIMVDCSLINLTGDFIFFYFILLFLCFGGIFNKTITPFVIVRYEMIVVNDVLRASLAIYHLISNNGD